MNLVAKHGTSRSVLVGILAGVVLASACAPAGPSAGTAQSQGSPSERKTITIAESSAITGFGPQDGRSTEVAAVAHAGLVRNKNWEASPEPWLATELPSIERGTWKVLPDGRMDTTWRLRSGVTWHDGAPFIAQDVVFGWEVVMHPLFAARVRTIPEMMESVTAPDDSTLRVVWKGPSHWADRLFQIHMYPLPRHLVEAEFRAAPDNFATNPYFSSEFVGLGPYRLASWTPGLDMRLEAYANYFGGRPKIDTISYIVISDDNAALARVLANEVDVTLRSTVGFIPAVTAKERWESTGDGTVYFTPTGFNWLGFSSVPPSAQWFSDVRVRRAMLQAIDRPEIIRVFFNDVSGVPDTVVPPRHPVFPDVNRAVMKYPFDPARAAQLFGESGWSSSSDGAKVLVNQRGDRFSIDFRSSAGEQQEEQVQAAVAQYWQNAGIEPKINNISRAQARNDREAAENWPGMDFARHNMEVSDIPERWHSRQTPTETNKWAGKNHSRWSVGDTLIERWERELDAVQRDRLLVDIARRWSEDLPVLPLHYTIEITTVRKGISGAGPKLGSGDTNSVAWNIETWDLNR